MKLRSYVVFGVGFRVLGFRVLGFRVLGFRVWGLGFRVFTMLGLALGQALNGGLRY